MLTRQNSTPYMLFATASTLLACLLLMTSINAQTETTGAFVGRVTNSRTNEGIPGITVRFVNQDTQVPSATKTDPQGNFTKYQLQPGTYQISVEVAGFKPYNKVQIVSITETRTVVPLPILLEPETVAVTSTPTPEPTATPGSGNPPPAAAAAPEPEKAKQQRVVPTTESEEIGAEINTTDGRRSGSYPEKEVSTLPLGAATLVRTFDELALLLPGVALPPQTQGNVAGPGVGAGVGSAGQFAVNGLRSRANNFTVDGSDNNDEDIGVRRQGFFALVPQPVESIREYQVITLLAPAQYGRNIGAQVNAVSKSGGNQTHGSLYGFFNSSQLNSRNFFDTANGNAVSAVRANNQDVLVRTLGPAPDFPVLRERSLIVRNQSGGKDSSTLAQGGFVLSGPLIPSGSSSNGKSLFYFMSAEGQLLNGSKEESFAVPTLEQRGVFRSGATGVFVNPLTGSQVFATPTTREGSGVFSLFPFPNNPAGVYGANTFTQVIPASGQGKVVSGKADGTFRIGERQQSITARYNLTKDWRDIPVTGGALFSRLRPRVMTQNFSSFWNSELSGPNSPRPISNQVRLSYGRTRLAFEEGRDRDFLIPSDRFPNEPFLLNAPYLAFATRPNSPGVPNTGRVVLLDLPFDPIRRTTEDAIGPLGQVIVGGFSPIGVDVFNFPQRRVNNTYQIADTLTTRRGNHSLVFGTDIRRTELNSDLPRNSRPLVTYYGAPNLFQGEFFEATDFVAAGAPSGFFLTLAERDSAINLRYYQLNFFGQDEWRVRPSLSLSFGLRYEYNTPAREVSRKIENSFNDPLLSSVHDLRRFLDGRTGIYDPDHNNLAPRVGIAYTANLFGATRPTIVRAGYGIYYDQILGAVASQSRNVFPNFLTLNFGGGRGQFAQDLVTPLTLFNPVTTGQCFASNQAGVCTNFVTFVQPGTLNRRNTARSLPDFINTISRFFSSGFGITLPSRQLDMPMAQHYSLTVDQQLNANLVASAAYVGTQGRHLLRSTTPNLGPNLFIVPTGLDTSGGFPQFLGLAFPPPADPDAQFPARPFPSVGSVNLFESSGNSHYDALQLQLRGRYLRSLQFQVSYIFSKAIDDVSDVFDLAGAPALPQNSLTRAGERAPSNFDARHRFTYNFVYDFSNFNAHHRAFRAFFGGLEVAGTGQFQTGQPFTVNSIFDVNLDGNLTDRLNTTDGLIFTGDRQRPLRRPTDDPRQLSAMFLAPFFGQDGQVGRNTFRASNLLLVNLAVIKHFKFTERQQLTFRTEIFNVTNRANFGIPVRFLEAPGFGQATDTVTPGRRIQFALKYSF
jgi:hypothetical protein